MSDDPLLKMTPSPNGLFQLRSEEGLDPRLFNKDLAPTRLSERTWTTYDIAARRVGGYSGFHRPIAGIFVVDYFLIRGRSLSLYDLYRRGGIYEYSNGVNWKAVVALAAGAGTAFIGLVVPSLRPLYDYAWFGGFGLAAVLYYFTMKGTARLPLDRVPVEGRKA